MKRLLCTLSLTWIFWQTYEPDPPPDPRLAIPGYMSGVCRSVRQPSKAIWRIAPYIIQPFKLDKNSVGPGEAQQVVAMGFDPFLPETTLRLNLSQYGSIASVQNKTDPSTGSFLGIALVKFRDSVSRDGTQISGSIAAKRAESEFNGQRIGLHTVKVEADREGRKCKRYCDSAIKKAQAERGRAITIPPPPPPLVPTGPKSAQTATQAPINAPKGPSGRPAVVQPPTGPRSDVPTGPRAGLEPPRNPAVSLIEEELVLPQIKRKPYIYISHTSVPVLGTTIPHLKKRLKAFDWREVRLDRTGYYVIFDDSKRGEDETERCFLECNKAALFTYNMEMECQKYGNPNYERSPSPERAKEAKMKREEYERLKREQDEDVEIEKKIRAENLDPVLGALEQLKHELRDKIMSDIKMRIAIPIFHESLEPAKHTAQRRKLGLPDPSDVENKAPSLLFNKAGDTPPQTPRGRFGHSLSKPLRPHDPNSQRVRRTDKEYERGTTNAFMDERRRRPAPRPIHARGLHFRLQQMFGEDDDSDEEQRTSLTRDTEDQESRPLSRASRTSTPFDTESLGETPKKRRKVADVDFEEKETFSELHKQLVGHLLRKEPEDLATRELELVIGTLPRDSRYVARAKTELYMRQRARADDDLFQVSRNRLDEDEDMADFIAGDDSTPAAEARSKIKKKRRTKKEIEEEKAVKVAKRKVIKKIEEDVEEDTVEPLIEDRRKPEEPDSTVSFDKPQRIVDDDLDMILDIDGWQELIRDDEDMAFARSALVDESAAGLGDISSWARKQKEIKALNIGGLLGPTNIEPRIEGYYVPNATGSARTEGVKKIMNEEKSKYLPHRIKVQKAREERQAAAKANPGAADAVKTAIVEKVTNTASSRSNRVQNRRLVNDINLQKQAIMVSHAEADAAIRFNQLKKRKKLVKFDRSAIHGWGLYAEEAIPLGDFIIEYVGEKVRQQVANIREIKYDKQGIGSSYLFRMIDDEIVDATKKGGIARFINHSCDPNCTAKIIKVEGTPRIVIYAFKDVAKSEFLLTIWLEE